MVMVFTRAWVNFKRMQDVAVAAAALIYAGAVVRAFQTLPGGVELIVQRTLLWPAGFLFLSLAIPLLVKPLRAMLTLSVNSARARLIIPFSMHPPASSARRARLAGSLR